MDYSPFFGMNILVAEPALPVFYLSFAIFVLLILFYILLSILFFLNVTGGKDA